MFVLLAEVADACSFGAVTVCEKYTRSDAIVVAELGKISTEEGIFEQQVPLIIETVYKGNLPKRITLKHFLSTCDWDFRGYSGSKMLLYLKMNEDRKTYHAIGTGYGGEVKEQASDIYWLNDAKGSLKRTRISGDIGLYKNDRSITLLKHLANVRVTISNGEQSFTSETDEQGVYQFWDVPYGRYRFYPVFVDAFSLWMALESGEVFWKETSDETFDEENLELVISKESKCGGVDYVFQQKK